MRECASYNIKRINYRFHQASMRKLEALGLAKRFPNDKRKVCCWLITDVGQRYLESLT
jgi:hypothetical protein